MWAVYGLTSDAKDIERFLGFIYNEYFDNLEEDASEWDALMLRDHTGEILVGWQKGRAFFANVKRLRADPEEIERYKRAEVVNGTSGRSDTGEAGPGPE